MQLDFDKAFVDTPEVLNVNQVLELCKIKQATIASWKRRGLVIQYDTDHGSVGPPRIVIKRSDLVDFLNKRGFGRCSKKDKAKKEAQQTEHPVVENQEPDGPTT